MHWTGLVFAGLALALGVSGCSEPTAPDGRTEKGIIEWTSGQYTAAPAGDVMLMTGIPTDGDIDVITAPEEVIVGEEFSATITTIGLNGCWSSDGATTESDGLLARITPWDLYHDAVCTQVLVALPREVTLRFDEVGEGVIRVFGRKVVGQDVDAATDVVAEQVVRVVASSS